MKSNIRGKYKITFICINIFLIFQHSHALINTKTQTVQIYSACQSINMLTNTIVFTGQVILKYKNIDLHADKILISHTENTHHLSTIEAYGKPVTLTQIQDIGNMIFARSLTINYNINNDTITFIGNAYIEQSGNSIQGDRITYSIKNKKITAVSNQGNKILTTLLTKLT